MHTNKRELLLLKNEVFQIVGCAIEVLNTLDHGLLEKPYENAVAVEFCVRKIPFLRVGVILNFKHRKLEWEDCLIKFVSIRVHSWLISNRGKAHRLV